MEIVTGYFISKAPAMESARYLQDKGFKIEVLGRSNQEDFLEKAGMPDSDDPINAPYFNVAGGNPGFASGVNAFMMAGSVPIISGRPIVSLVNGTFGGDYKKIMLEWGVPGDVEEEIINVIDSGRSVVLVECKTEDKSRVTDILNKQGAQNIHS